MDLRLVSAEGNFPVFSEFRELFLRAFSNSAVSVTGRTEEEYRHQLGRYGITGELATRPVASLSGGQKSRVAFAQMTMPW